MGFSAHGGSTSLEVNEKKASAVYTAPSVKSTLGLLGRCAAVAHNLAPQTNTASHSSYGSATAAFRLILTDTALGVIAPRHDHAILAQARDLIRLLLRHPFNCGFTCR